MQQRDEMIGKERADIEGILKSSGAWLTGHFLLTSGKHSDQFLLMARAFEHPEMGRRLGEAVAAPWRGEKIATVVGPAMGGVILGYEVARALGARAIYTEKTEQGGMALRRGFHLEAGERVLVVEDAVSTGGSVEKLLAAIRAYGPDIVGVGAVADRSGGRVNFGVRAAFALTFDWPHHDPGECPLCREGRPLSRPKG